MSLTSPNHLLARGRWIVVVTQVWIAVVLVVGALLAAYSLAAGDPKLRIDEPWDSFLVAAFFAPSVVIILGWSVFCLVLVVLMRQRRNAGSLVQLATLASLLVPVAGVRWFDQLAVELTSFGDGGGSNHHR